MSVFTFAIPSQISESMYVKMQTKVMSISKITYINYETMDLL